jgi:type I restriction enzyme, S subunit
VSELPEGWTKQALGSIADCRLGKMLDAEKNQGELRPYLRNTNVQWGTIDLSDVKEMRITDDERDRYALLPGDLLVCEGGEPGRCAVWRDDREMYVQKALHRVRPLNGTSVEYLRWFLQHATLTGALENLCTGSTIKHLPGRQLARIIVPSPPVWEQRRIADWLNEIEPRRASITDRLAAASAIVDRLRAAVLAAACSGRLTADWRDEHGTAAAAELPDGPPAAWKPNRLGDVARVMLGGTPSRKVAAYWGGDVPWVSSGEVANCRLGSTREKITEEGLANCNAKVYPAGTVLIAMIGEGKTRGQAAILDIAAATNQNAAGVVVNRDVLDPEYVWRWALSEYERTRDVGRGGNQPALNGQKVRELIIPVPPLEEQQEILRRVAAALTSADRLTTAVAAAEMTMDRAMRGALAKGFCGEYGPDVEPATIQADAEGVMSQNGKPALRA